MAAPTPAPARTPLVLEPGTPIVEFSHVSIGFDRDTVLKDISFTVHHGEMRIILGPAGCGKSVIMKLANGLLTPDSGEVRAFGRSLATLSPREMFEIRAHIGMVFQESALFDSLDVEDNVAYRFVDNHCAPTEIHTRVVEALRFVELEQAINKFPSELSGGMRRRVAIARAIITQPEVILYDSPTGGLDPVTSNTIVELIMKQRDVYKTSSLLVTHRLQDAFTMATHQFDKQTNQTRTLPRGQYCDVPMSFLILRDGKVIFDGDVRELTHSKDEYIREYIS